MKPEAANTHTRGATALPAAAAAAICGAVLVTIGAGGPSWLDSAELIAAARELGGIHPPGHPAWLSLAALADLLPLGPYSARVVWLSAACCAAAAWWTVRLAGRAMGGFAGTAAGGWWAFSAGLLVAFSGSTWMIGGRAEVYGLALATNLWAIDAALRAGDHADVPRAIGPVIETAVAVSLGLLNHHYVTLFVLPAVVAGGWPLVRGAVVAQRRALLIGTCAAAFLGLAYAAPSMRALADTEMGWGDPASMRGFWQGVTAAHFQVSVTESTAPVGGNLAVLLGALFAQMGVWPAALGLLGLGLGALRMSRTWWACALALVGGIGTKSLMAINTHNPDDYGYTAVASAMLAVGVAMFGGLLFGARGPLQRLGNARRLRLSVLVLPWALLLGLLNGVQLAANPAIHLAGGRAADVLDDHVRQRVSPGSLYLSNFVFLGFNEQAWRIAEGRRPDITNAHLSMRTGDTDRGARFNRWLEKRRPEHKNLAVAASRMQRAPIGNILQLAERADVFAEHDPANRIPAFSFGYDGVVQRLLRTDERGIHRSPQPDLPSRVRRWAKLYEDLEARGPLNHQTREVLVWQHALQAAHALRLGWPAVADFELRKARKLAPKARSLQRLGLRVQALQDAVAHQDRKRFGMLVQRYHRARYDELVSEEM